mmetsp:Transcript_150044/g.418053  ORF Transcript_150044/g.418053 Transcript_150044/m.418053 type:complete len:211 (+) Transcript_150044:919-1551(+)
MQSARANPSVTESSLPTLAPSAVLTATTAESRTICSSPLVCTSRAWSPASEEASTAPMATNQATATGSVSSASTSGWPGRSVGPTSMRQSAERLSTSVPTRFSLEYLARPTADVKIMLERSLAAVRIGMTTATGPCRAPARKQAMPARFRKMLAPKRRHLQHLPPSPHCCCTKATTLLAALVSRPPAAAKRRHSPASIAGSPGMKTGFGL